jgi:hypothetical protein
VATSHDDFLARVTDAEQRLFQEEQQAHTQILADIAVQFAFVSNLLATVRVLLDDRAARIPDTLCGVVAMSLYAKIFGTCRSVFQLCRVGGVRDAPSLTRSAVEALITLRFITQKDCEVRAGRWVQYSQIGKWKALRKLPSLVDNQAVRDLVRQRAEAVAHLYPRDHFWASGLGVSDLRRMAEVVNLLWHYDAIYWFGSQPTHATAIGVDEYFQVTEEKKPLYEMGLSARNVHSELAAASDVLIRGLMFIEATFDLGLRAALTELQRRHVEAFGSEPPMAGRP